MFEHVLGTVEAGGLGDIIGGADSRARSGSFDLVVQAEERSRRIVSGALVKDLGNDQWSVYLLDVAQIEKIVERHGLAASENVLGVAEKLGLTLSAQAAGLGSVTGFIDKVAEGASAVGESLGVGAGRAERIAEKLAARGVDPGDVSGISAGAKHLESNPGLHGVAPLAGEVVALGGRVHESLESLDSVKASVPAIGATRSFDRLELGR